MFLSIVIPAYNAERFIADTLEMLASQINECEVIQEKEIEVIVVNDGSQDKTGEIVADFSLKNSFIKLINQANKGESGARNTGIKNAIGEYIYFLDCDDSLEDESIEHFVKTIKQNPECDFFAFEYSSWRDGKLLKTYDAKFDDLDFNNIDFRKKYLSKKLPCHICSVVTKRSVLTNSGLEFTQGLRIGADIEFLLNVLTKIQCPHWSNRKCYKYQIRNDSIMQGYKSYSVAQYHSFEVRRDIVLSGDYQSEELKNYSNFWIENQLLSNIVYYLRSDFNDPIVTKNLISDCELLHLSVKGVHGAFKNKLAICLAKILPMKLVIKILKNHEVAA